jgi:hypothetical protein
MRPSIESVVVSALLALTTRVCSADEADEDDFSVDIKKWKFDPILITSQFGRGDQMSVTFICKRQAGERRFFLSPLGNLS